MQNGKDEKVGAADQEHLRTVGGDEEAQQASQRVAGAFDEAIPMEVDTLNLDGEGTCSLLSANYGAVKGVIKVDRSR